jgi:TPR repeat protein
MMRLINGVPRLLIVIFSAAMIAGGIHAAENGRPEDAAGDRNNPIDQLQKDAEQGNVKAQYVLGCCYNGDRGFPKDPARAAKWWGMAAANGNADAQFCLGLSCFLGQGVSKNAAEAVQWWKKAADQDHADAQYFLGLCYHTGIGVPKSTPQAVYWLQRSAGHGNGAAVGKLREIVASQG